MPAGRPRPLRRIRSPDVDLRIDDQHDDPYLQLYILATAHLILQVIIR
jgi:hypothetical protein